MTLASTSPSSSIPPGIVVAHTDRPDAVGQDLSRRPFIAKAVADFEAAGVWREGNDLFYAVAVPVATDFTLLGYSGLRLRHHPGGGGGAGGGEPH